MKSGKNKNSSEKYTLPAARKNQRQQTQWAAQFAVASELCKEGYEVAFTMGHTTPEADLFVRKPQGKSFRIDVKGLGRQNGWIIKKKSPKADLYYVLAYVPRKESNRFFILTQAEANKIIASELARLGRPSGYAITGFGWKLAKDFEGKWESLPDYKAG